MNTSNTFPKVLLLGNGINRAFNRDSWETIIKKLWTNNRINCDNKDVSKLPFSLQIVLATDDNVDHVIKNSSIFSTALSNNEHAQLYKSLLVAGFDHILTTNYTYELEQVAYDGVEKIEQYVKSRSRHTDSINRDEAKYMLHTYGDIPYMEKTNKVWHIHGEYRKASSIIIGQYYYGKLLEKIYAELGKRRDKQLTRQLNHEPPIIDSWVDAFIMGDVYVLGFGYDTAETDLWWLLNRKKRENAAHGKVYFYEPSFGREIKHALLECYDVEVNNLGYTGKNVNYQEFYTEAIQKIITKIG